MRRAAVGVRAGLLALVVLVATAGCGSGDDEPDEPAIPADAVPGPASRYERIVVTAGERSAEVPARLRDDVVPLVTAREFAAGRDELGEYGLDTPVATIEFVRTGDEGDVTLHVGDENFDGSAYYVRLDGAQAVRTVLDDQLDPVLALVGAVTR